MKHVHENLSAEELAKKGVEADNPHMLVISVLFVLLTGFVIVSPIVLWMWFQWENAKEVTLKDAHLNADKVEFRKKEQERVLHGYTEFKLEKTFNLELGKDDKKRVVQSVKVQYAYDKLTEDQKTWKTLEETKVKPIHQGMELLLAQPQLLKGLHADSSK